MRSNFCSRWKNQSCQASLLWKKKKRKRKILYTYIYIRFPYLATLQSHKLRMFRCQHQHSGVTRKRKADYTILPSFFGGTTMTMTMSRITGQKHRRRHYSHVVKLTTTVIISTVSFYYRQLTCCYCTFNTVLLVECGWWQF